MMTSSALRLLAARVATTKVKSSEAQIAANMRSVVRSAYSGSRAGSSVTGAICRAVSGRPICWAPCTTSTGDAGDHEDGDEVAAVRRELPPREAGEQRRAHALRELKRHEPILASRLLVSTAARFCPSRGRDSRQGLPGTGRLSHFAAGYGAPNDCVTEGTLSSCSALACIVSGEGRRPAHGRGAGWPEGLLGRSQSASEERAKVRSPRFIRVLRIGS